MRSKIWRILTVAMAAAMIACVATGCAQNGNKTESSTASVASDASKTEGSKDESKTESKDESKTESKDESKTESKEESKTESVAESTEASTEDSSEAASEGASEDAGEITVETVAGAYEHNVGEEYTGIILNEDGTLIFRNANGYTMAGTWELADGKITLRVMGGAEAAEFKDGKLVSDDGNEFLPVEQLSVEDNTDAIVTKAATSGTWESNSDDNYTSFTLKEDGTGTYKGIGEGGEPVEFTATWEVENGVLNLHVEGGLETLVFGISATGESNFISPDGTRAYAQVQE